MLFKTLACQDIEGRGDKFDFDLGFGCVVGFGGAESVFNCVDAFVAETGNFDICADFCGLRGQALADVGLEFVLDNFVGKGHFLPYIGISVDQSVKSIGLVWCKPTYVIDILKASRAFPYFLFSGQPICEYSVSMGVLVFSATCRMMDATILPLLNFSSHLTISSGDTRRFDRSI